MPLSATKIRLAMGPSGESTWGVSTMAQALERAARTDRGITLVDSQLNETPLPWADLADGARHAAAKLVQSGVAAGDRVCILAPTTAETLVALFGSWRLGAVPVLLPLPVRASDIATMGLDLRVPLGQVGAGVLVIADVFEELVGAVDLPARILTCGSLRAEPGELTSPPPSERDDLAYLQFTSGTTSLPRVVALTHAQLACNAASLFAAYGYAPDSVVHVSWLPLYHDMGLMSVLLAVCGTHDLVLQPPQDFMARPGSWIDALSRYRGPITTTVAPSFAYRLASRYMKSDDRDLDLSHVAMCGSGAEPIDPDTLEAFAAQGAKYGLRPEAIAPMYGLAEATVAVTASRADEAPRRICVDRRHLETDRRVVPAPAGAPYTRELMVCGYPVPGVELSIVDEDGDEVGENHVGEICVRSTALMEGYWNDEEATEACLEDGRLRTGDLGFLVDGALVVCGRLKDMIIVGGRNLYPEDYEHIAQQVPGVRPFVAAFALPDRERMVVVIEPGRPEPDPQKLAEAVMTRLDRGLSRAPDRVLVVKRGAIPRTTSGKTQRSRTRDLFTRKKLPVIATAGD